MSDEAAYEDEDAVTQVEEKPTVFDDLRFEEFAPIRFRAAQAMGMRWPIPKEEYRNDGGLYRCEVFDASYVLWLCSIPVNRPKEEGKQNDWYVKKISDFTANRAAEAALQWADEMGISLPNSKSFWAAIGRFEQILIDIQAAYTTEKGADPKG